MTLIFVGGYINVANIITNLNCLVCWDCKIFFLLIIYEYVQPIILVNKGFPDSDREVTRTTSVPFRLQILHPNIGGHHTECGFREILLLWPNYFWNIPKLAEYNVIYVEN